MNSQTDFTQTEFIRWFQPLFLVLVVCGCSSTGRVSEIVGAPVYFSLERSYGKGPTICSLQAVGEDGKKRELQDLTSWNKKKMAASISGSRFMKKTNTFRTADTLGIATSANLAVGRYQFVPSCHYVDGYGAAHQLKAIMNDRWLETFEVRADQPLYLGRYRFHELPEYKGRAVKVTWSNERQQDETLLASTLPKVKTTGN